MMHLESTPVLTIHALISTKGAEFLPDTRGQSAGAPANLDTKCQNCDAECRAGGLMCACCSHPATTTRQYFDCPRTFNIDRKNLVKHLSFGGGVHLCVGMALARMEIKVAAREIMTRLKDIKLAVRLDEIRYVPTTAMLTMKNLPLTFSRRQ